MVTYNLLLFKKPEVLVLQKRNQNLTNVVLYRTGEF